MSEQCNVFALVKCRLNCNHINVSFVFPFKPTQLLGASNVLIYSEDQVKLRIANTLLKVVIFYCVILSKNSQGREGRLLYHIPIVVILCLG